MSMTHRKAALAAVPLAIGLLAAVPDLSAAQDTHAGSAPLLSLERQGRLRAIDDAVANDARSATGSRVAQVRTVQDTPTTQPQPVAAPSGEPDLSALRYFASRGDTARLQAEIARLRALYPNWTPPADPLAVPQNVDRQLEQLWQFYSEGRYAEVRAAITDRQTREPGWTPPADLLNRLALGEARTRLINASDQKQYATVIELGASNPNLLNCSDVDVLWRIAESFVRTERRQRGVDAYRYILQHCDNPQERLATAQKALDLLPLADVKPLLALERTLPDGQPEFASLRDGLARRAVAEANKAKRTDVDPADVDRLEALATSGNDVADMLLLGWYLRGKGDLDRAEPWFRKAIDREPSASAAQGLALILVARGRPGEAEAVIFPWRADSDDAQATYLASATNFLALTPAPVIAPEILTRMASEILNAKYVAGAQQLGWYAQAFKQPQVAARWFETALRWDPQDEPSAYGLLIARDSLNDRPGVAEIQRNWVDKSPRIAAYFEGVATATVPREPRTARAPAPVERVEREEATRQPMPPRPASPTVRTASEPRRPARQSACQATAINAAPATAQQQLMQGWCLMDLQRPLEAAEAFEAALKSPTVAIREDAAYGQSLAYLRLGLTDSAAVAATKSPLRPARAAELQVAILANRALAAFSAQRYRETLIYLDQRAALKAETTDLMILRANAYRALGDTASALQIFRVLAEVGNGDAMKGVEEIRSMDDHNG
ncbi:tetratricopeptide repeat protein [Rhizobium straminoryzae]|uniref:Cellulose synthase n=1 Tax=Rhizobium straminoryzae TaxID=1387186 RepID=A0A549THP1_9HYPH|nr:tetratricopeptide repeat protein [Rhizobium straminoryzae]TRL42634.1 cellulose synthase [Rhizobium straminoryzae]